MPEPEYFDTPCPTCGYPALRANLVGYVCDECGFRASPQALAADDRESCEKCSNEPAFIATPHDRTRPAMKVCWDHLGENNYHYGQVVLDLIEPEEFQPTDLWDDRHRPDWETNWPPPDISSNLSH